MGQLMDHNTLTFQLALGLNKPVKGFSRQNCSSSQLDSTYGNNSVILKIKPGQLSVKGYKINLPDREFRIKTFLQVLLTFQPVRELCT